MYFTVFPLSLATHCVWGSFVLEDTFEYVVFLSGVMVFLLIYAFLLSCDENLGFGRECTRRIPCCPNLVNFLCDCVCLLVAVVGADTELL